MEQSVVSVGTLVAGMLDSATLLTLGAPVSTGLDAELVAVGNATADESPTSAEQAEVKTETMSRDLRTLG